MAYKETCHKEYKSFHITHNRSLNEYEIEIHMQENRQHAHTNYDTRYTLENPHWGKNLASKSIHHHVLFNKNAIAIQPCNPSNP